VQIKWLYLFLLLLFPAVVYSQQDIDFKITNHFFTGKKILKVKRDFNDPYLWVLAQNNQVYRVNSKTQQVDDYTSIFSTYANLQFIDIAGRSRDTVFIATRSLSLIQFKNGFIKLINDQNGIPDTINSIGIDYRDLGKYYTDASNNNHILLVGTKRGMYNYDIDAETLTIGKVSNSPDSLYSQIFETTYRKELYSGDTIKASNVPDSISYLPVLYYSLESQAYCSNIWEGRVFGNNIRTAFETSGILDAQGNTIGSYDHYYWGNEKGMFDIPWIVSRVDAGIYARYLNGITINKITSIYGLTSFGNPSNPAQQSYFCENLLIGTMNGFYFSTTLNPIWGDTTIHFTHFDQLGNIHVNDISVNAVKITSPICENGVWLATDNGLYFLTPDYSKSFSSSAVQAISFQNQRDSISEISICPGSSVTAVLDSATFGLAAILWFRNGQLISGQNGNQLNLTQAGDYQVELLDPCSGLKLESNHLKVDTITRPTFTFNYPDSLIYCSDTPATLQVQGSNSYQYRWYKDDVPNGANARSLTITQNGKYKAEVSACDQNWISTKEVQVNFIQLPTPVLAADKATYCLGDQATLNVKTPIDPAYTITWFRDGVAINSYKNLTTVITNISGTYTISVSSSIIGNCSQASAPVQVMFNGLPTLSIRQIINTTLCNGQSVSLEAEYNSGKIKWSTGESTDQITVTEPGIYRATVTTTAGCTADDSIEVQFLPNPVLAIKDTSVCAFTKQNITLIAPAGYQKYVWNNQPGNNTFVVNTPQTVQLTVTDANGCEASQQITVSNRCTDIRIPNTFTPNGDGVNDTWVISGLEYDPTVSIKVYNRYGGMVFQNKGYYTAWNGQYNGNKLPSGVYYYIIVAQSGRQTFSGSIAIVY
jgi:gliding motility-associated-like protein